MVMSCVWREIWPAGEIHVDTRCSETGSKIETASLSASLHTRYVVRRSAPPAAGNTTSIEAVQ